MSLLIGHASKDVELSVRLLLAVLCGAGIGRQREQANKAAGLRTHILVSLGSALFTILSYDGFGNRADPSGVAAQIVVGIGFIGAGAILHSQLSVSGLTTAANIWATAAIEMAAGVGVYYLSIVTTVIVLAVLQLQKHREAQAQALADRQASRVQGLDAFGRAK